MMVQTEIGLLPEDWEVVQIGDIFKLSAAGDLRETCFSQKRSGTYCYPIYSNSILQKGLYGYTSFPRYKSGCITITGRGTLGHAEYRGTDFDAIIRLLILQPRTEINGYLIAAYINKNKPFFFESTSIPQLTVPQIRDVFIPIPTKSEQQNIASALSSIDKLIDDLGRTIQKKQRIREGAMEELLSGKKRLPGFTEEWVEKKIGDIGKTYSGLTGKTKEDFGHGNAKYITFLNVLNNAILDITIFEAVDVRQNEKQNAAHYGDLFFNTSSETPEDVGTCACLNTEVPNLYLNSFCFGYRLNDEEIYGNFLAYFFRTKAGRDIMYSLAQGATRYNLSKEYFNEIKITMPPTIKEQQSISYVFEAMTDEISLLESERAKYEQIRSGMMEELLTGKKRLTK